MRSAFVAVTLTVAVWSAVFALQTTPAAPAQAASGYTPRNVRERFAVDLLARLGNTAPTLDTIAFVVEWTLAEDGEDGAIARNNPLNTTMCGYNMTGAINSDGACGVQTYATYQDGIDATVATLVGHDYDALVSALQTNDTASALQVLVASPWAESRYNNGAGWPHVELTPASAGRKSVVTTDMVISADFYATGSPAWAAQGGMHYGVDYAAPHGSPVYLPFDCVYEQTGHYDDAARMGDYLICHLLDGYEYYSGHLESVQTFAAGQVLPAGTLIGMTNVYDHTHIQIKNTSGELVDFAAYYAAH